MKDEITEAKIEKVKDLIDEYAIEEILDTPCVDSYGPEGPDMWFGCGKCFICKVKKMFDVSI